MKYRAALALILILAMQVALRVPFLSEPLERDEGAYAYIAQRMLAGNVPYRDYFDHKPPAVYFIYAAVFRLFGDTQQSIRLFTLFFSLLSTLAVFSVGLLLWGRMAALLSAFLYAVFSGGPYIMGTSANTETFMVLPMLLALCFFLLGNSRENQGQSGNIRERLFFLAGIFSGLAVMIKQVALLSFLAFPGYIFLKGLARPGEFRRARFWRENALLLTGFSLFHLFFALYFVSKGALLQFVSATLLENLTYVGTQNWNWSNLLRVILRENAVLWVLALASCGYIVRNDRKDAHLLLAGWALLSLAGVFMGKAFYGHYFIQIMPALCLLSAYGIVRYSAKSRNIFLGLGAGVAILALLGFSLPAQIEVYSASPDQISAIKYSTNKFIIARDISARLGKEIAPGDSTFVWAAEPQVYFYTRSLCASRYIYYYPLVIQAPGVEARRKELMRELEANPPRFIVWADRRVLNHQLFSFIDKYYKLYFVENEWAVFKIK